MLLALHSVPLMLRPAQEEHSGFKMRWWHWLLVAALDVEANFLLVLAYQYTDITSVTVLDAFTVPTVIALSAGAFGERFSPRQLGAALLCILGIVLLVVQDFLHGTNADTELGSDDDHGNSPASAAWLGDLLVLLGAAIYGVSNVTQERLLSRFVDRVDYLAHLGGYGALIALTQTAIFERDALVSAWNNATAVAGHGGAGVGGIGTLIGLEIGFAAALVGFYMLVARLLELGSSATLMNLSLLTSDFFAVAVGVGLLHSKVGLVYAAAFGLTVGGLVLYHVEVARAGGERRHGMPTGCCAERLLDESAQDVVEDHHSDSDPQAQRSRRPGAVSTSGTSSESLPPIEPPTRSRR
jgi:solute carrier family 35 protein F1/2